MSILQRVFEEHYKLFGKKPYVIASAPGRIDFLNTHQDYKGLPVVSVAVNMRTMDVFNIDDLGLLQGYFFR